MREKVKEGKTKKGGGEKEKRRYMKFLRKTCLCFWTVRTPSSVKLGGPGRKTEALKIFNGEISNQFSVGDL